MMRRVLLNLLLASAYLSIGITALKNPVIIRAPETLCKYSNETQAARRLNLLCQDCSSLFNSAKVGKLCRQNCFSGPYVPACVKVLYYWDEKDIYKKMVEKISGKTFAIWNDQRVELEMVHTATESLL